MSLRLEEFCGALGIGLAPLHHGVNAMRRLLLGDVTGFRLSTQRPLQGEGEQDEGALADGTLLVCPDGTVSLIQGGKRRQLCTSGCVEALVTRLCNDAP